MRRILVEAARRKQSHRRGGARQRYDLADGDLVSAPINDELLDLDEALERLSEVDRQAAEIVKLRVFAGMTIDEAAEILGVSPRTSNAVGRTAERGSHANWTIAPTSRPDQRLTIANSRFFWPALRADFALHVTCGRTGQGVRRGN